MGTVVRLEDYCKSFKSAEVLKNINLTLESGKVIGLKGKNGSGKTMLMRAISGLILPTSGKVYINDKELGRHISFPPSIGILIENPSFISNYTGFKNLKILASIQNRISDDEIRDAIRKVGLDPDDKRTFKKYSLGMKQRGNVVWTASAEFQNRAHGMNGNLPHLSEQERSSLRQYIKKIVNMRCPFS